MVMRSECGVGPSRTILKQKTHAKMKVTVKLKLSAGVHIEECGVRPRRGQVAWAWAGDSGGPDIGPGPQSSDNTGTACPMAHATHQTSSDSR